MLDKILVPLDGSELGEVALAYARELAAATHAQVHLVCVAERPEVESRRLYMAYLGKTAERFREQLKRSGSDAPVTTICLGGEPADAVLTYAEQVGVNLIIMASHGHSGIMRWTMGSTARKISQRSMVPVLLVRAASASIRQRFSRILVTLDGSELGEASLPYVEEIARVIECEVILLRVVEAAKHVRTIGGTDFFYIPEQMVEDEKAEALRYLGEIQKRFVNAKGLVRLELREGDAASEILKVAKNENVRLLAMSSHGKSGMMKWVFGSVSSKVLEAGKTPLLLVRPRQ
jgi:nucleotide-binding universal stress UspA family protein